MFEGTIYKGEKSKQIYLLYGLQTNDLQIITIQIHKAMTKVNKKMAQENDTRRAEGSIWKCSAATVLTRS